LQPAFAHEFATRSLDDVATEAGLALQRWRPGPREGLRVRVATHYYADELRCRGEALKSQKVIHDLREALAQPTTSSHRSEGWLWRRELFLPGNPPRRLCRAPNNSRCDILRNCAIKRLSRARGCKRRRTIREIRSTRSAVADAICAWVAPASNNATFTRNKVLLFITIPDIIPVMHCHESFPDISRRGGA